MKATIPSQFKGMTPILVTTIRPSGEIDEESQRNLIRYCLDCGAVAIGHLAFASEFFKLTIPQRAKLISIAVDEVAGRVPVFIGISGPSTAIAIENAKQAQDLGADMVMASIPYVTVPGADDVRRYYEDICKAVPLPVIVQDTVASSSMLTAEVMLKLSAENANLRHAKPEGKGFLAKIAKLKELGGDRMDVMGGFGGLHFIHMLRLGVTSFMTGTEAVDIHGAALQAYLDGDGEKAAQLYYNTLMPYLPHLVDYSEEVPKRMLHYRGIIAHPNVLEPALPPPRMSEWEWRELVWALERISYKSWRFGPTVQKLS
jgi:4-hydroxy-tetrahydrodipicolinate synthase